MAAFGQQTGSGSRFFPPISPNVRMREVPPADRFSVFNRQDVAYDLLLAHQVAQEHVVRRIPEDMAYCKYAFWSSFDGLLDLYAVGQTGSLLDLLTWNTQLRSHSIATAFGNGRPRISGLL